MGGLTHITFHPTLVFSMLDEMLDAFDQGFTRKFTTRKNVVLELTAHSFSFFFRFKSFIYEITSANKSNTTKRRFY